VNVARDGEERAILLVEDDGVGWTGAETPRGSGLGTKIIKAMASNLKSAIKVDSPGKGTRISLSFAL
jgi:two-component sensor histidine kinase